MSVLPMLAFIAILYFLLVRPQQKRQKQHKELVSSIKKGDKVVTSSGMIATVSKVVSDHEVVLEIANNVHCKFVRSAISSVVQQDAASAPVVQAVEGGKAAPEADALPADGVRVVSSHGSEDGGPMAISSATKKKNADSSSEAKRTHKSADKHKENAKVSAEKL
jgi:preprotein translocase subunit YajC